MPAHGLKHFSRPETLKAIAPSRLLRFLEPHRRFFISRGLPLPLRGAGETPDYEALAKCFLSPDRRTPDELIHALWLVDEMSTAEGMDSLLSEVIRRGLRLDREADQSPADVAVQAWLLDKDILERKHAEQCITKVRSFESYQSSRSLPPLFKPPPPTRLRLLERSLDDWYEAKQRGRGTHVYVHERGDGVWFLVRHGDAFRREESLEGRKASSVCYRPSRYDVLIYQPETGELMIHAGSQGEKQLYRSQFGLHLFGDEDFFPGKEKYTLEPLRQAGEASLGCADIEGVEWVKLREVQVFHPGDPWELVTRQSEDLFAVLKARNKGFPEAGRLVRATFKVKFADCRTPRSLVIRPSNIAQFTRDDDSALLESWMKARGFIKTGGEDGGQADAVLAGD